MSNVQASIDGRFDSLFEFLPVGAYRCAPDGTMLRANPALVALHGFRTEAEFLAEVNRQHWDWYIDTGRRRHFQALLLSQGYVKGLISEVSSIDAGQIRWVSEHAHLVQDEQGTPLYYEGTAEDITEQVLSREALQRSEQQMRLIASQVPGMVFALHVGIDGRRQYQFVSDGVRELYGLEPDEVLRRSELIREHRHPADIFRLDEELKQISKGAGDLSGEFRIVRTDGEIRWVVWRSTAVAKDETGILRVGVLLDVTEQREAEQALRQSEAVWKLALEGSGDGVWDWNLVTGEEYLSASMLAMYGFEDHELPHVAQALDERTHPDDRAKMLADRQAHLEGKTLLYRNEHRVQCKDGQWKYILSRGLVISRSADGVPLRMVGTHTDITELREAEAQRRTLEEQLRESQKMEAIGTLAGGVAHDFNNLLAAILGNLALAREDVGEGHPAQESLAEIQRAGLRARQLVQQILAFSRRQAQAMEVQALTPLVEEALTLLRSLMPGGVRLNVRIDPGEFMVLADSTQVQQVVMNLCNNAWQAMRGRSGDVSVELQRVVLEDSLKMCSGISLAAGHYALLSVSDSGQGIAPDVLPRIFEPFYTTKPQGEGTGLGLSVVHGIVTGHGGAIDVQSRLGQGSRFQVYLPLVDACSFEKSDPAEGDSQHAGLISTERIAPRHVVYVDDYEAMLFLASRMLGKQGYRVTTFLSGEQALQWLKQNPETVDLLVTDQNMPGLSGVDVAREARAIRPDLRVVIMSGYVNEDLREKAQAIGVHDVLAKQDRVDDLVGAIKELLPPV